LLEPDAGKLARPVLRGAERREALGLPAVGMAAPPLPKAATVIRAESALQAAHSVSLVSARSVCVEK
jgi:hypothetical protein